MTSLIIQKGYSIITKLPRVDKLVEDAIISTSSFHFGQSCELTLRRWTLLFVATLLPSPYTFAHHYLNYLISYPIKILILTIKFIFLYIFYVGSSFLNSLLNFIWSFCLLKCLKRSTIYIYLTTIIPFLCFLTTKQNTPYLFVFVHHPSIRCIYIIDDLGGWIGNLKN